PGALRDPHRPRGPGRAAVAQNFAHGNHSHTQKKARVSGGRTPRDRARRVLSQNFLADRHALELVVKAAAPEGLVLELGAGEAARPEAGRAACSPRTSWPTAMPWSWGSTPPLPRAWCWSPGRAKAC